MTGIKLVGGLPFITCTIKANDKQIELGRVLIDTGSAATIFELDELAKIDLNLKSDDKIAQMTGIGGREYVVEKAVEKLLVGNLQATSFTIQMGALDYGLQLDGIIGIDFILFVKATLDFKTMEFI